VVIRILQPLQNFHQTDFGLHRLTLLVKSEFGHGTTFITRSCYLLLISLLDRDNPEHLTKLETTVIGGAVYDLDWDNESKKVTYILLHYSIVYLLVYPLISDCCSW